MKKNLFKMVLMRNQNRRKVFHMMNMGNMINCAAKIGCSFRRNLNLPIYFNEKNTAKITFVKMYITSEHFNSIQ